MIITAQMLTREDPIGVNIEIQNLYVLGIFQKLNHDDHYKGIVTTHIYPFPDFVH